MLQAKTRLLITHSLAVLPHVDRIVLMEKGKIARIGTFQELRFEAALLQSLASRPDSEADNAEHRKVSEGDSLRHSYTGYAPEEEGLLLLFLLLFIIIIRSPLK